MLPLEVQWFIIFSSITLFVFLYLIFDWIVIDYHLDKKDTKNRSKLNID